MFYVQHFLGRAVVSTGSCHTVRKELKRVRRGEFEEEVKEEEVFLSDYGFTKMYTEASKALEG